METVLKKTMWAVARDVPKPAASFSVDTLDAERRQTDSSDDSDSGSGRHFLRNEEVSLSIQGPQLTVFILMIQPERS